MKNKNLERFEWLSEKHENGFIILACKRCNRNCVFTWSGSKLIDIMKKYESFVDLHKKCKCKGKDCKV